MDGTIKAMPKVEKLSARNKWTYTVGGIGRDMAYSLFANFLLTFILLAKGVTESQFAAISVILIVCRIWDGINDPIMGGIIENTHTRWGKFKPWILIGVLTNSIILTIIFLIPLGGWAYIILFGFLYLLWDITFTMNDIAYWAMLPSLTSDPKGRATITSMANLFAGVGGIVTVALIPILTAGDNAIGGNSVTAYRVITLIIVACFIGFQMITLFGVKEKPLPIERSEKIGFKKLIRVIFKNDQLLWTTLVMLLYNLGSALILAFGSIYVYLAYGYNGIYMTMFTVVFAVGSGIINFIYPALSSRFSRRKLQTAAICLVIFGYIWFLFCGLFLSNTVMVSILGLAVPTSLLITCVGLFTLAFGQSMLYMIITINLSNTVEYNDWKYGSRDEGIIFSLRPFMAKMGSSLQQLFVMVVYLAIGILSITNKIADIENETARGLLTETQKATQIDAVIKTASQSTKNWLLICMVALPIITISVAYIIMQKKFKIDEKFYAKILTELAERDEKREEGKEV